MVTDNYGRKICMQENCIAYFTYNNEQICDAGLMYHSKESLLCKLTPKYKIETDKR